MSRDHESDCNMVKYFWQGDLERWCDWNQEALNATMPHIVHLWNEYKEAERRLSAAVKELP